MNETKAGAAAETKKRSLAELGAALREAREGRNMSLDDLAAATCIRRNYLEDIEAGCFDHFKALVYARGFVRSCTLRISGPDFSGICTSLSDCPPGTSAVPSSDTPQALPRGYPGNTLS